jgi:hypothetical protein
MTPLNQEVNSLIIAIFDEEEKSGDGFQHALELTDRAAVAASFFELGDRTVCGCHEPEGARGPRLATP